MRAVVDDDGVTVDVVTVDVVVVVVAESETHLELKQNALLK